MTEFTWTDRHGVRHSLNSPGPIEAEIAHFKDGLNKTLVQIETANGDEFVELDREARAAVSRLKELSSDATNWDKHVTVRNNAIVQALLQGAIEFRKNNALLLALAYMNRERAELAALSKRNPEEARALLAANITKNQEEVLISIAASVPNAIHLTRAEAYKLIDSDPTLRRPPETGDGWFEWTNLQGERYRLSSSLMIELEIARVLDDAEDLLCDLSDQPEAPERPRRIAEACNGFENIRRLANDLSRYNEAARDRAKSEWVIYRQQLKQMNDR